jgi:Cu(I)/Ag(I) efflux system membrane protein CusA/SilA
MIRDENGLLTGYVYVDISGRDPGTYIKDADRALRSAPNLLPHGYSLEWG